MQVQDPERLSQEFSRSAAGIKALVTWIQAQVDYWQPLLQGTYMTVDPQTTAGYRGFDEWPPVRRNLSYCSEWLQTIAEDFSTLADRVNAADGP
jgi:hypothetical protein